VIKTSGLCPLCGRKPDHLTRPAELAPFIAKRCGITQPDDLSALHCVGCKFDYFNYHFTSKEILDIYQDYRGEEYITQRLSVDPGYAVELQWIKDHNNTWHERRVHDAAALFHKLGIKPDSVLDFGGEDGWLTRGAFPEATVKVYDISDKNTTFPIESFDTVFAAFIFEHVQNPVDLGLLLKSLLKPGGYLYIEIPRGRQGQPEMLELHEHVSYWSANALWILSRALDMRVVDLRWNRFNSSYILVVQK
jgi:SAM-dependent methyltransferase